MMNSDIKHDPDWTDKAGQAATETAQELKDKAEDFYHRGKEKVLSLGNMLGGKITERPLTSLLIAAGVGIVIGRLCRR